MRGESHVAMNLATGGIVAGTGLLLLNVDTFPEVKIIVEYIKDFLFDDGGVMPQPLFIGLGILLYMLGSLLPDIDTPYSTLGRIIHLPFEHRTWTHAIWAPLALMIAGIWVRLLFWLGFGILVHDFFDSFSASGIDWFYPHKRRKSKTFKLYHTGEPSEYVFGTIVFLTTIAYWVLVLQMSFDIFGKISALFGKYS